VATAALLALVSQTPILIVVPDGSGDDRCAALEEVAAVTALIPGVRVVRGEVAAREQLGADVALDVERSDLVVAGVAPRRVPIGRDLRAAIALALERPAPLVSSAAAANREALMAACRGDAARAFSASGPAIGPALLRLDPPKGFVARGILERWVAARASSDPRRALPQMRAVVAALERGEIGPTWRRLPIPERRPSGATALGDRIVLFESGAFVLLDATTGVEIWRTEVGAAEPRLEPAGNLLLAFTTKEIAALDLEDGRIRWSAALDGPSPEVVSIGDRIIAAGRTDVVALDRSSGKVEWSYDPLADVASGPILAGSEIAIAAGAHVVLVDPSTGAERRRVLVGDEISSPLILTRQGPIWALVGSDQIAQIDPARGEVTKRIGDLFAAEWPPAVAGDRIVVALKGARPAVTYLDASLPKGFGRSYPGGVSPIVALPSASSIAHPAERPFAIVGRGLDGAPIWVSRQKARVTSLAAGDDLLIGASGKSAVVLDPAKGIVLATVEVDARITEAVLGPRGGALVTEDGAVYGLPARDDPRRAWWLERARLELAAIELGLGLAAAAGSTARAVRDRNPGSIEAIAILAAASEKARPKESVEAWLDLLARTARDTDPMAQRAVAALARLTGLAGHVRIDATAIARDGDRVVVASGGKAITLELPGGARIGLDMVAAELRAAGDYAAVDGAIGGKAGLSAAGALVYRTTPERGLERIDPSTGAALWTQTFDGAFEVLAADESLAVVESGAEAKAIHLLDVRDGARKWMVPVPADASRAWLGDSTVLLDGGGKLIGLAAADGRTRITAAIDGSAVVGVAPRGSFLVLERRAVVLLDGRTARPPRVPLPSPIVKVAIPAIGSPIALLENGALVAIDPVKGRVAAQIQPGPISELVATDRWVVAASPLGLLVFDAGRSLRGP
jgi:outer membrane protein assembly factor BamB